MSHFAAIRSKFLGRQPSRRKKYCKMLSHFAYKKMTILTVAYGGSVPAIHNGCRLNIIITRHMNVPVIFQRGIQRPGNSRIDRIKPPPPQDDDQQSSSYYLGKFSTKPVAKEGCSSCTQHLQLIDHFRTPRFRSTSITFCRPA